MVVTMPTSPVGTAERGGVPGCDQRCVPGEVPPGRRHSFHYAWHIPRITTALLATTELWLHDTGHVVPSLTRNDPTPSGPLSSLAPGSLGARVIRLVAHGDRRTRLTSVRREPQPAGVTGWLLKH
jgi:hypothetical protein